MSSDSAGRKGLRRRRQTFDADGEGWLVTYGDAITLLLAFFVMILSVSDINVGKVEALKEGLAGLTKQKRPTPFNDIKKELEKIVGQHGMADNVNVEIDKQGVKVEFSNFSLYDSGSAAIRPGAVPMLSEVSNVIRDTSHETHLVEVEGHTDDVPITSERFPSNWELSGARASNVVKYLIGKGVNKERLKASGYADSRPKQTLAEGETYTAKQRAANRRVVIYIKRY